MILLSYLLVLVLGQYGPLLGMITAAPLAFLLVWAPARVRVVIGGLIGGCAGPLITYAFAGWIFTTLAGMGSFGPFPFLAATLSLALPIWNDYKKYVELRGLRSTMSSGVAAIVAADVMMPGVTVIGYMAGIGVGAYWFLMRNALP